jgi:hypothetical protein
MQACQLLCAQSKVAGPWDAFAEIGFMTQASAPWTFADFEPGHSFGSIEIRLDSSRLALWSQVFVEKAGAAKVSSSVLVAAMTEGYLKLLQPRPPRNIHASQVLTFTGRQGRPGCVQLGSGLWVFGADDGANGN